MIFQSQYAVLTSTKCATAAQHDVGEQALPQVQVDAVDRIDDDLVHTGVLLTNQLRIEEDFRGTEPFRAQLRTLFVSKARKRSALRART